MKGYTPPPRLSLSNEPLPITRSITITEGISVKDLAEKLEIRAKDLIARLLVRGVFATINQTLDTELASEMARFFGADTNVITFEEQAAKEVAEAAARRRRRCSRRRTASAGGHHHGPRRSRQDLAARRHPLDQRGRRRSRRHHAAHRRVQGHAFMDKNSPAYGRKIVFLDTPGHEAFTRMRARGAKVTDIVVLVVAADDGVMPQTLEAIDHAHAAEVPIIVAVNKIDKPDAQPDRVKKQLADRGLMPEDWGGDHGLRRCLGQAENQPEPAAGNDLPGGRPAGTQGDTRIVRRPAWCSKPSSIADAVRWRPCWCRTARLRIGDNFIVGNVFGKVRAMFDDRGNQLEAAPPSTPVEILGLEGLPQAGDQFLVVADRDKARGISEYREQKAREATLAKSSRVSLEGLAEQLKTAGIKELHIILKARRRRLGRSADRPAARSCRTRRSG